MTSVVVLDRHGTIVTMNDLCRTPCVFTLSKLYVAMRVCDSLNLQAGGRGPFVVETREN
jgi:hypothetical protein